MHSTGSKAIDRARNPVYIEVVSRFTHTWDKALSAAEILRRYQGGHPLSQRERKLALQLAEDPSVTNRLIHQALRYLGSNSTENVSVSPQ